MSEQYTPAVARALAAATEAAAQFGPAAEPWFVFLKLIEEDEGRAAGLLARAGLAPATARERLGQAPPRPVPPGTLATALADARTLALELSGESVPGSDHLLLALVRAHTGLRESLQEL